MIAMVIIITTVAMMKIKHANYNESIAINCELSSDCCPTSMTPYPFGDSCLLQRDKTSSERHAACCTLCTAYMSLHSVST